MNQRAACAPRHSPPHKTSHKSMDRGDGGKGGVDAMRKGQPGAPAAVMAPFETKRFRDSENPFVKEEEAGWTVCKSWMLAARSRQLYRAHGQGAVDRAPPRRRRRRRVPTVRDGSCSRMTVVEGWQFLIFYSFSLLAKHLLMSWASLRHVSRRRAHSGSVGNALYVSAASLS